MTDFAALIPLLVANDVEFIIVGGAAATAHGSARLTLDLDVVYAAITSTLSESFEHSHQPNLTCVALRLVCLSNGV